MLNTETKRHIDNARDILVGVVPNPTAQIDQITNALIYKFMDDMDQAAIKVGADPSFFVKDLEPYAWSRLMSDRLGNQERMNLYAEALTKFANASQLPQLFRDIFKSSFLPYRSPEVLGLFLKEINYFDYAHPEELGNAYEYLLQIMGSQGDAGQFRTPRHIIDFVVDVVNPTKDDKVLDPACGTAGFLISAYKHILEQHDGKNDPEKKEKPLTPEERKKLFANFEGHDIDPSMVRIAQVNMYLHQFKNPKVGQYDTLSQEERWGDRYDVILANPPFMSPRGGIRPHNKFSIQSTRSEVLFVDYIMNHLRPKGRAGIIVPEGIIFKSDTATKQLRKNLVEDGLYAVVSLPSGVFNPYAGVKTSILLFDNARAKETDELMFVKIENDGYDLGAQRRPITKNDLPEALEVLAAWRNGEKKESSLAQWVAKATIAETGDYNLSVSRYATQTEQQLTKFPEVEIGEVCTLMTGGTPSTQNPAYYTDGTIKWLVSGDIHKGEIYDCEGRITELAVKESNARILPVNSVLIALNGQGKTRGTVAILRTEAACNQSLVAIDPNREVLLPEFLFFVLKSKYKAIRDINGDNQRGGLNMGIIRSIKIPLPPLEVQQQIVAELDGYQKIIDGARQIVDNWKPSFVVNPSWSQARLADLVQIKTGRKDVNQGNPEGKYPFFTCAKEPTYSDTYTFDTEALLVAGNGDVGAVKYYSGKFEAYQRTYVLSNFSERVLSLYLYFYLDSTLKRTVSAQKLGNTMPYIKLGMLQEFQVPLPPLEVQQQIVDAIEAERSHVESARTLIDLYTQKTTSTIAKLWSE